MISSLKYSFGLTAVLLLAGCETGRHDNLDLDFKKPVSSQWNRPGHHEKTFFEKREEMRFYGAD
ncbi:hypothetical protein [Limoniibacter endophyticus]|uniref:Uncharacterized protein n=1 Tax=Limoniibacter endophyticus TaxID=1565040 RepID=A0A8J3DH01_9HYPH|nr:hypothetical protein [Limoniibacter endophyticus]GHC65550.1 hypothetical protein GCM10010136_08310 [Limoniibacter endophyticus]